MTQQLARYQARPTALTAYNEEEVELLKTQIAPGTTDKEFALFVTVANRRGLDPFRGHIFAIKRQQWDKRSGGYVEKMTIQVAHAGLLALAERTNGYRGTTEPQFAGEDGVWTDVWLAAKPPAACKVGVYRKGFVSPVMGVALWREYVQTTKDGKPMGLWETKPTHMLEKCALSKALRRAFPDMEDAFEDEDHDAEPDPGEYVETDPVLMRAVAIDDGADEPPYQPIAPHAEFEVDAVVTFENEPSELSKRLSARKKDDETEPIVLTNDATGETIEVPAPARHEEVVAKARAKLAPKTPPPPAQKLWEGVKAWAAEHGTDPQRLRYYLTTSAGVPEAVTPAAMTAWQEATGHDLDALYERYVAGESSQQSAADGAAEQGALV